ILAPQPLQDLFDLGSDDGAVFALHRSAFHLERALFRIAAQLLTAADERRVQRAGALKRDRRARAQLAVALLQGDEHAAHPRYGVTTVLRPAAVRGATVRDDFEPREPFVPDGQ